jgi:hypothetical protein
MLLEKHLAALAELGPELVRASDQVFALEDIQVGERAIAH